MSGLPHRALRAAALACLLSGCALYPPPEGVSQPAEGGIDAVIARFGIAPLDPGQDPLPQLARALGQSDPSHRLADVTYSLETGNRLPRDWLVQTPDAWDMPAASVPFLPLDCPGCDADFHLPSCEASPCAIGRCAPLAASVVRAGQRPRRVCLGQSDALVDRIYGLVAGAERAVDITMLQPPADFRFLAALRNAVTRLAASRRPVTLRIMIGDYPPDGTDPKRFLQDLLRDAAATRGSRLTLYVGDIRSCEGGPCGSLSWNHAKIIAVDGKRALVGGHNQWTQDYLLDAPVHDLSMQIEGPAARAAHRFADALWGFVCSHGQPGSTTESYRYRAGDPEIAPGCLAHLAVPPAARGPGKVPVLALGRLASGIADDFADQSQLARTLSFGAARKTIRMVQQDVAFALPGALGISWPDSDIRRMLDLLAKGGDVFLVLSNEGAKSPVGGYSNGIPIARVGEYFRTLMRRDHEMPEERLTALLCAHLHLAPLRFGPDASWPHDRPIGVHAKFWMVDDRLFYVGSENLYPVDLQEFGYALEDPAATAEIRRDYWDRLWRWSSRAAISGADAPRCIFRAE